MGKPRFKTKLEFIQELGISKSTFYRLLDKKNIKTTRQMLSPRVENELRVELGFPPLPGFEHTLGHNGTYWDESGQNY